MSDDATRSQLEVGGDGAEVRSAALATGVAAAIGAELDVAPAARSFDQPQAPLLHVSVPQQAQLSVHGLPHGRQQRWPAVSPHPL